MPRYTREQLENIRRIKRMPEYRRASPRVKKSLWEAVIVESGIRDLDYGDRDSKGILQQRNNGAWGAAREDVETDVRQYLEVAERENRRGGSAGQLAQRVQRSAFPHRYDEHSAEAAELMRGDGRGKGGGGGTDQRYVPGKPGRAPQFVPARTETDTQGAVTAALLDKRKKMPLLARINEQISSGQFTTHTPAQVIPGKSPTPGRVVDVDTAGKGGRKGKATIHELFWNGPKAVNVKNGAAQPKGFVSGHTDHVHFAADRTTMKRAASLAKKLGLHVGEYGKGITSGHVANSNHYKPFGAMDVSGDVAKMAQFANTVAKW